MQTIITIIIFLLICLIITYYYNLYVTQTFYTKSELSHIFPQISIMINKIFHNNSYFFIFLFFIISCFTGILLLSVFNNWIINSALLPVIFFYSFPRIAFYFEKTRVTISKDYKEILEIIYTKYYIFILIGFYSGYVVKLIDNWNNSLITDFFWFTFNITIITGLTVVTLRNYIFD